MVKAARAPSRLRDQGTPLHRRPPIRQHFQAARDGVITAETTEFLVKLGDVEQVVGVTAAQISVRRILEFLRLPGCGRRARVLRSAQRRDFVPSVPPSPAVCGYRCEPTGARQRAALRIPKLIAMLNSESLLRLKPVLYGTMERRARHEAALQRNLAILKRHDLAALAKAIDKAEE